MAATLDGDIFQLGEGGKPMHGCISRWLTRLVAAALVSAGSTALAQQSEPSYLLASADQEVTNQFVSSTNASADDLAARVADLEKALKDVKKKADDDKKKAAGKPTVEPFGRIFFDTNWFDQDAINKSGVTGVGNAQDGIGFRTVRLGLRGKAFEIVEYQVEADIVGVVREVNPSGIIGNGVTFKDVFIGLTDLPLVGNVRVGHFKEAFSLEELTGDAWTTFIERNMGDSAFAPARHLGINVFNWTEDKRATYAVGLWQTERADFPAQRQNDDLACAVTARATWLPWYDECTEGRGLLHVGGGYSYRDANTSTKTFSSKDDAYWGPTVVTSGALALSDYQLANAETAMVFGPLSVQGEIYSALVNPLNPALNTATFYGGYGQISYFLTGEHRPYKRELGVFDRIKPYENFFRVRAEDGCVYTGKGAWEVAYRYDYVDLSNPVNPNVANIAGGSTIGLNWYLNPYTRVMWNYVHTDCHRNGTNAGYIDAFLMRAQIDF